jgi:uncharacterized membrane protein
MPMKNWKKTLVIIIVLAAFFHIITIIALPYVVFGVVQNTFLRKGNLEKNVFYHGSIRQLEDVVVPGDNPDTMTSRVVYDIGKAPLRVKLGIPEHASYWSFSLFANNLDNFYTLNDMDAKSKYNSRMLNLVIAKSGDEYRKKPDEVAVISPSNTGIGLIRITVRDRYSAEGQKELASLKKIQMESQCELVE